MMTRLIRPYDFLLDGAAGWRGLEAESAAAAEAGLQLEQLAERLPPLDDPHGTLGGAALPRGVAIWGDEIFIADPPRCRLLHWRPCDGPARPLPTIGGPGAAPRQLDGPLGLALSARDDLVVADAGNRRLQLFTLPGLALRRILGPFPSRLPEPPDGRALWEPVDVARGPRGQLYVLDRQGFVWRLDGQGRPDPIYLARLPEGFEPLRLVVDRQGCGYLAGRGGPGFLMLDPYGELLDPADLPPDFAARLPPLRLSLSGRQLLLAPADSHGGRRQPLPTDLTVTDAGLLEGEGLADGPYLHHIPPAATYALAGLYRVQPLDSQRVGNPWHRLTLELQAPERTSVRAYTCASDVLQPALDAAGLLEEPPQWGPWQAAPANADEFLVQSPPGRYLYLALALRGPGDRTPTVERIYVHARRESSLRWLPAAYQADETSRHFLDRFLSLADTLWGEIESQIEDFGLALDIGGAPAAFLPWLASWFDLALEPSWTEAQRRAVLREIVELYSRRGTIRGLRRLLQLHASAPEPLPQIVEHYPGLGHPLLETWLGQPPGDDAPHHFTVLLPACALDTADKRAALARLIGENAPAHSHFCLRPVAPGVRLGSATVRGSALGLDSLLGGHPTWRLPAQPPRLDGESVLGVSTALAAPPEPRAVSVRLGYTRLGEARLGCRISHPCRSPEKPEGSCEPCP